MCLPLPKVLRSASPVAGFLAMSDVNECPVGFKWLWWLSTRRHLAVNRHTTANWCFPLIWLLFMAFEAQMHHCWGHFGVSVTVVCLARHFVAPLHQIEITCSIGKNKLSKMVGNSSSYPLSSLWSEITWITVHLWRVSWKRPGSFLRYIELNTCN